MCYKKIKAEERQMRERGDMGKADSAHLPNLWPSLSHWPESPIQVLALANV